MTWRRPVTWQDLPRHRPRRGTAAPSPTARQDLDADRRSSTVSEDRQRRDHSRRLRVVAERHLQLRPQRLRLPRPLAGGLRAGALIRHEVTQHGRLLRVQPGCLLRRFRGGDDQAREDPGQDAGHQRRDMPGLPVPKLVAT